MPDRSCAQRILRYTPNPVRHESVNSDFTARSDRNRSLDCKLRDLGIESRPFNHLAVWLAKLKPLVP
jgi:hypothetical protein